MWKITFEIFIKSTFGDPWVRKTGLTKYCQNRRIFCVFKIKFIKNKKFYCIKSMRDTKEILGKKIVHFKKIYNLGFEHFLIRVISFVYKWMVLLKIKMKPLSNQAQSARFLFLIQM